MIPTGQAESLLASEDEESRVLGWRVKTFVLAGYPVDYAETLALTDGDTHKIEGVIRANCDPDLAVSIFF